MLFKLSRLSVAGVCFVFVLGCRTAAPEPEPPPEKPDPALQDLVKRAEAAIEIAGATPGREYANRLRTTPLLEWLQYFRGESTQKPDRLSQAQAIKRIESFIDMATAGPTWPAPGKYTIPYAKTKPNIDGDLTDDVWKNAWTHTKIYPFNSTEEGGPSTTIRLLWDDTHLYAAFDCRDTDVVSPQRERDDHVYFDDCVEMFILPNFRFRTYWEIVIGPSGSVYDSVQGKDVKKWGAVTDPSQNMQGLQHAEVVAGTLNETDDIDNGYTVEIAVPFSELPGYARCPPRVGDDIKMMLVRLDRSDAKFKVYAFRPLQAWGHNIWNHATFELGE